jgi:FtsZ-interacting cell division protein ZipA
MNKKIIVLILVIIGILVFVGLIVGANITKTNEQQEELNATLTKMEENNQYDASAKEVYEQAKEIGGIEVANATIES